MKIQWECDISDRSKKLYNRLIFLVSQFYLTRQFKEPALGCDVGILFTDDAGKFTTDGKLAEAGLNDFKVRVSNDIESPFYLNGIAALFAHELLHVYISRYWKRLGEDWFRISATSVHAAFEEQKYVKVRYWSPKDALLFRMILQISYIDARWCLANWDKYLNRDDLVY